MTDSYEVGETRDTRYGRQRLELVSPIDTEHPDVSDTAIRIQDRFYGLRRGTSEPVIRVRESDEYPRPRRLPPIRGEHFFVELVEMSDYEIEMVRVEQTPLVLEQCRWKYPMGSD